MNSTHNGSEVGETKAKLFVTKVVRYGLGMALTLLLTSPAFAQYGGGGTGTGTAGMPGTPGYTSPGYGSGKAIGIGVGAAVAGAVVLYVALHHRHQTSLTGCVQSSDEGLRLANEKSNRSISLLPAGADVKPGELVELTGKKSKGAGGADTFQATKLVKNLGACGSSAQTAAIQ